MPLADFHFFSPTLGKQTAATVLLPEKGTPPFAVFYLLHGLSDDHTMWLRRTRIEAYAGAYPLMIVMPDGLRGFYTNHNAGPAYASYFAEELPGIIERNFPARTDRGGRCVGGLSMGGYGAMRLALGYPRRYVSANSHSGSVWFSQQLADILPKLEWRQMFGTRTDNTPHDLTFLARQALASGEMPALRLDCGTEDFLLRENRLFHAALNELGVPHEYEEYPGGHDWEYWDQHVRTALRFHARYLQLAE